MKSRAVLIFTNLNFFLQLKKGNQINQSINDLDITNKMKSSKSTCCLLASVCISVLIRCFFVSAEIAFKPRCPTQKNFDFCLLIVQRRQDSFFSNQSKHRSRWWCRLSKAEIKNQLKFVQGYVGIENETPFKSLHNFS